MTPAAAARPGRPVARALAWLPDRIAAAPWPLRLAACGGAGAVAGLGQVPAAQSWAMLAGLVLLFALHRRGAAGFAEGWAFGAGHFGLALRWITEPFRVDVAAHGWMAPFALLLMAGGMALFWGLAVWGARRLRLGPWGLAALWAGAEVVRSHLLGGFPWALIGHAGTETPVVGAVAWVGVPGLTLLTLLLGALVARLGASPWQAAPAAAVAAAWVALDPGPAPAVPADAPVVRVVQPNVPQHEKWDPAFMGGHRALLLALSRGPGADLVVWPETAIPELLEDAGPVLAAAARAAGGAAIATGVARAEGPRYYNALVVTDGTGAVAALYDKAHLVPFGEFLPWGDLLARWGLHGLAAAEGQGFSAGPGPATLAVPGLGLATPLICYEGIFAEEVAEAGALGAGRPRFLLLVTNDAWFGRRAGPEQHLALGRLRAVELGLPLVRSANTGISAVVDGRGRVLARLPLDEAGALDAALPPALPPTPYARAGDWPAFGATAVLGLLALWRDRRPGRAIVPNRGIPRTGGD